MLGIDDPKEGGTGGDACFASKNSSSNHSPCSNQVILQTAMIFRIDISTIVLKSS